MCSSGRSRDIGGRTGKTIGLRLPLVVLSLALVVPAQVGAAASNRVPDLVNYQGLVFLEDGSTDVTGTYDIEFFLYDAAKAGTLLWGERHAGVQAARGLFNVLLGAGAEIQGVPHGPLVDVFKLDMIYVQLRVGDNEPIPIRQRFSFTAHAFRAQNAVTAVHGVPPGTVMPFAGNTAPYGWLLCDGRSLDATANPEYKSLWEAIGVAWGGTGEADFKVPNLGGRTMLGTDGTHGLGVRRGEEGHSLTVSELPGHRHSYVDEVHQGSVVTNSLNLFGEDRKDAGAAAKSEHTGFTTGAKGSNWPHNTMQPSAVVKYIIKW